MKLSLFIKRAICITVIVIAFVMTDYGLNGQKIWLWRDLLLGGMAGLGISFLLFQRRIAYDFRQSMVALFHAYSDYLSAITQLFLHENTQQLAEDKKQEIEQLLQPPFFPEWVYKAGFSTFFRAGHRHFLVRAEQVAQVLFAMHYIARHAVDVALVNQFRFLIEQCVFQMQELISALLTRLELEEQKNGLPDFIEDITSLEKAFREAFPISLELLEMSPGAVGVAAFIYDLKDLRVLLLKLSEALR
jgi:hypothetical protein